MVEPPLFAVTLAGGIDQRQSPRSPVFEKILFQGDGQLFGETDADKTAGGDGIAFPDQAYGLMGCDDFFFSLPHGRCGGRVCCW